MPPILLELISNHMDVLPQDLAESRQHIHRHNLYSEIHLLKKAENKCFYLFSRICSHIISANGLNFITFAIWKSILRVHNFS